MDCYLVEVTRVICKSEGGIHGSRDGEVRVKERWLCHLDMVRELGRDPGSRDLQRRI